MLGGVPVARLREGDRALLTFTQSGRDAVPSPRVFPSTGDARAVRAEHVHFLRSRSCIETVCVAVLPPPHGTPHPSRRADATADHPTRELEVDPAVVTSNRTACGL